MVVIFLLMPTRSHQEFQDFVKEHLQTRYLKFGHSDAVLLNHKVLASVWHADLSKVAQIVGYRYSKAKGSPARDPVDMFRSLLVMELLRERSIDSWVHKMRYTPIFAIFSGFLPNDVPGVGTFYDFIKRIWLASSAHLSSKLRKPRRKPNKGKKKGDKSPIKKPGIVKRLVERYLQNPPIFHSRPHDLFQKIFKECFVVPSTKHGLLGDINALSVAGDGSSARTGASCYGKLVCDCRKNGIYKCSCHRKFSDPDASWGWDSYREKYYFGRTLYAFTAADSPYDLPVYLNFFKAYRHDSLCFVYSLHDFLQQYPEFKLKECLLDSAHDAYAIYNLLNHHDVSALIDLNPDSKPTMTHAQFLCLLLLPKTVSRFALLGTSCLMMVFVKTVIATSGVVLRFANHGRYPVIQFALIHLMVVFFTPKNLITYGSSLVFHGALAFLRFVTSAELLLNASLNE